jgi:hypothetical protein
MKYAVIMIPLLLLSGGPTYVEWTMRSTAGQGNEEFTSYADLEKIRRTGHLAKIWTLHDYTTPQIYGSKLYLSVKIQTEIDCQQEQYRRVAFYAYSEHMGYGNPVASETDPGKWNPIIPGSLGEGEWKVACGKQ